MSLKRSGVRAVGRALVTLTTLLTSARIAPAQVGLTSHATTVMLVARAPLRGSLEQVGPRQEQRRAAVREASVLLRISASTGYSLVVRRASSDDAARVLVRDLHGRFRELESGASVTVARDSRGAGEWEREVYYRIESPGRDSVPTRALPVRYEIAVDPVT